MTIHQELREILEQHLRYYNTDQALTSITSALVKRVEKIECGYEHKDDIKVYNQALADVINLMKGEK